jgi:enamine deaminase RidA (YjgF/YER057c/UK114 family)
MSFADRYTRSLNSSNLMDDSFHHQTEALQAAAHADRAAREIGSLLSRVKNANVYRKAHEGDTQALASLLTKWRAIVQSKGMERKWVKAGDLAFAGRIFERVADRSLAHWLDGKCPICHGSKVNEDRRTCAPCFGTGEALIEGVSGMERNLILDMVSELNGLESSHAGAANALLRREE